ncbi:terpene synthase family protein [Scytonema sp. NUACC26]|uniref:terpene synthase family protein n=1 Tax=Scytonema sp. NUACC26 TaxID=3140176 RepID=UPI0034DC717F
MTQLTFPKLHCPLPSQINKYVDAMGDYSLEWVSRFNLLAKESTYRRFSKSKFFLLAARAYPNCPLEELKIGNDWLSWVFIWDDLCDLSELKTQPEALKVYHKRFLKILNGAELTSNDVPLTHALYDLRQRTVQRASKEWFRHFLLCFEEYFQGCVEEAAVRAQNIVPDVDTYMMIRRASVGGNLFLTVSEFCNNFMLSDFLRNHDFVDKLKLMTINVLAWCNDVFSASREMASGDVHNIVLVLHYQQQLSLETALERAVIMHDEEMESLISLEASIPVFGNKLDTELAQYISIMHTWIRGNLDWYSYTDRYQSVEMLEPVKY